MVLMYLKHVTILRYCLTLSLIICTPHSYLQSDNSFIMPDSESIFDDEFDFDFAKDIDATRCACDPTAASQWLVVATLLELPKFFDQDFYKSTVIPYTRSLSTYPNLHYCCKNDQNKSGFSFDLFYNFTDHKYFRKEDSDNQCDTFNGTLIDSYLNIDNPSFLEILEKVKSQQNLALDIPVIFGSLKNSHLQERRFAAMLQWSHELHPYTWFSAQVPLQWMIRNIQLPQADKDALTKEFQAFYNTSGPNGTSTGITFDEDTFARQHLIADAFGFGSLELDLTHTIFVKPKTRLEGHFGLILPTDIRLATGLYGSYFNIQNEQPNFSFCCISQNILSGEVAPTASEELYSYFVDGALNYFSSIVLPCNLGYQNGIGIKFGLTPTWHMSDSWEYNGTYNFNIFMPHEQYRFFKPVRDKNFSKTFANLPDTTEAEQLAKLNVLEKELTKVLFPQALMVNIFPGIEFVSTSVILKKSKSWTYRFGYNSWFRSGERLMDEDDDRFKNLNTKAAINEFAWAIKLFGKIDKKTCTKNHDLVWSLWADAGIFNNNIGNDFTLGANCTLLF